MLFKNIEIKKGETVRKFYREKGKLMYAYIKWVKSQSYKKCHGADLRYTHTASD